MDTLISLLKVVAKGALLLLGGLLLFGGGACALIGVANIGQGGWINITLIAAVVAMVGFVMIKVALLIKRNDRGDS